MNTYTLFCQKGTGGEVAEAMPLLFRVENGYRVSRNSRFLRTTRARRAVLDMAAFSGMAAALARLIHFAFRTLNALRNREETRWARSPGVFAESFTEFGCWADDIAGEPARHALNRLYAPNNPRFVRIRVMRQDHTIGWAVLLGKRGQDEQDFGGMSTGCIVDCQALPGEESAVMEEATRLLRRQRPDLIVTRRSHGSWRRACAMAGFIEAPLRVSAG